ncbi:MAG: phage major capsid protein, partial [Pseudomonadota bacterium]|nr:phage major capsid protein [Pseudomonadota bacterium]
MDMPLPNTAPIAPADPDATAIDASFDIVARQDRVEQQVEALRSEVEEVKLRVDRIAQGAQRAAQRPALVASSAAQTEVKGFVDGYLRRGNTHEIKSISGTSPSDGGYAVPRQIDAMIARQLTEISPIRALAQVVQTGSAGYRKLVAT